MQHYLYMALIALAIILVAKFVFKISAKTITTLIINALVGLLVIWLINFVGLVSIPLNLITCLIVGIFGLPGVIVLVVLCLLGIM